MGKPIVSVSTPEIDKFREYVAIGRTREEYLAHLDRAVAQGLTAEQIERQTALAATMTWDANLEEGHVSGRGTTRGEESTSMSQKNGSNGSNGTSQIRFRAGLVGAGHISEFHVAALRRIPYRRDRRRARPRPQQGRSAGDAVQHPGRRIAGGAARDGRQRDSRGHAAAHARRGRDRGAARRLPRLRREAAGHRRRGVRAAARSLERARARGRRVALAALRSADQERARQGARRRARRPDLGRHPAQLALPALRGRPAAAAVPHRRLSVPRPRHPRALRARGVSRADREASTPPGGRAAATATWRSTTGARSRTARRARGRSSSRSACGRCSTRSSCRGPRA